MIGEKPDTQDLFSAITDILVGKNKGFKISKSWRFLRRWLAKNDFIVAAASTAKGYREYLGWQHRLPGPYGEDRGVVTRLRGIHWKRRVFVVMQNGGRRRPIPETGRNFLVVDVIRSRKAIRTRWGGIPLPIKGYACITVLSPHEFVNEELISARQNWSFDLLVKTQIQNMLILSEEQKQCA